MGNLFASEVHDDLPPSTLPCRPPPPEGVLARLLFLNDCLNAQGAKDEDLTACILELSSVKVAALLYLCLFVFFNLPTLR